MCIVYTCILHVFTVDLLVMTFWLTTGFLRLTYFTFLFQVYFFFIDFLFYSYRQNFSRLYYLIPSGTTSPLHNILVMSG